MNFTKNILLVTGLYLFVLINTGTECRATSEYIGSDSCIECHDTYKGFKENPHMITTDSRRPGAVNGCESCHGPGSSHAESGEKEDILSFENRSLITQEIKNNMCLKCHDDDGKLTLWHGSEHDNRGISCSDCHKMHSKNESADFAKEEISPDDQCLKCHSRVKSEIMRQSHHPIREGKIKCADCHNPHGTISDNLVDAQQTNLKCFECHEEKRGPFLWEHPSVTEDCLTCHTAHGSTHSPLLETKAPYLCQRCHSDENHAGTLYAKDPDQLDQSIYRAGSSEVFYRACLNCHVSIHGSNHPSGKSLLR
jgi:DmsE family decaheme c-type cytochrome